MKDFICALIIVVVLAFLFSTNCFLEINGKLQLSGIIPQHSGDSGMDIDGNGGEPADAIMAESQMKTENNTENKTEKTKESLKHSDTDKITNENSENSEDSEEFYMGAIEEEQGCMNEMLLAFWHGVMAVLIGEASALLVALAWIKVSR